MDRKELLQRGWQESLIEEDVWYHPYATTNEYEAFRRDEGGEFDGQLRNTQSHLLLSQWSPGRLREGDLMPALQLQFWLQKQRADDLQHQIVYLNRRFSDLLRTLGVPELGAP